MTRPRKILAWLLGIILLLLVVLVVVLATFDWNRLSPGRR